MNSVTQFVVNRKTIEDIVIAHLVAMSAIDDPDKVNIEFSDKDFWNRPLGEGLVTIKITEKKEEKS